MEPLLYLLILAAPRSANNFTYGHPVPLRIKTYGVNNINFGAIRNLQIRRGGGDSPYNKYRQPLSLSLAITIEPLYNGFAAIDTKAANISSGKRNQDIKVDNFDDDVSHILDDVVSSRTFTTIGDVIKSFRPFTGDKYQHDKVGIANENYTKTMPMNAFVAGDKWTPVQPFAASDEIKKPAAADIGRHEALKICKRDKELIK